MKDVMLWVGAGQIDMAIARRTGYGKKIVVGDRRIFMAFSSHKWRTDHMM